MDGILKDIFSNVNEWLKFVEAKNAAIIAFNLCAISSASSLICENITTLPQWLKYYFYSFILLNIIGLSFALFSFWPQTRIEELFNKKNPKNVDNLLFYGDITNYDERTYLSKLYEAYGEGLNECSKSKLDYANQIIVNSNITSRKCFYFKVALFCTIIGLLTPFSIFLYSFSKQQTA